METLLEQRQVEAWAGDRVARPEVGLLGVGRAVGDLAL